MYRTSLPRVIGYAILKRMKKILYIVSLFPILPSIALAQTLSAQGLIGKFLTFSNSVLIPFALGIAFLFFLINVIRFFVVQGSEEEGRKNAKNLALYSVLAFVVLIVFWGVVNLLAGSIGLNAKSAPTPDYIQKNEDNLNRSGVRNPGSTATNPSGGSADTPDSPINLPPPQNGGAGEDNDTDPCAGGRTFNENGVPCSGLY